MNVKELKFKLEKAEHDRIEFTPHFYYRARRRNIDVKSVKKKLKSRRFHHVRENRKSDPRFEYSFKVTVRSGERSFEMPIYFNLPGVKILVKSVWPR